MKSLCNRNTPVSLFNPVEASALLPKLQAQETDRWTYCLVDDPDTADMSFIAVYDEDNMFVGHL